MYYFRYSDKFEFSMKIKTKFKNYKGEQWFI